MDELTDDERALVRELFALAADAPAGDRRALVDREAVGLGPGGRAALAELLAAHENAGGFLAEPTVDAAAAAALPAAAEALAAPAAIGPFRIVRELGSGGFGTVYLAEQQHPVRRPVAVKLINPGMDTRQVVARFEAERQALALMDHPNIARVFEAGATPAGRPYFVMELVDGPPVTDYCRAKNLPLRARLGLFVAVCRAVQHAHQKGVIHRDLKPTNVLVAEHDERPVPKVIDFGVAKALHGPLADLKLTTGGGPDVIGTPQYMSPEQAAGSTGGGVDTRTDVYALGVLLYELIADRPPFDPGRLRAASPGGLARILQDEEPPPPGAAPARRSAAGSAVSPSVSRLVRAAGRDLDWVVARAMEKDRDRRYPTADALAADVARYLADEPVSAGPPTTRYRLAKFVRRHRGSVAAVAAVLVALAIGGSLAATGFVRARDDRARAAAAEIDRGRQQQLAQAADFARRQQAALAEANRKLADEQRAMRELAEQVARANADLAAGAQVLLHDLYRADPQAAPAEREALRKRMDALAARLWSDLSSQPPALAAPLHSALAYSYAAVGLHKQSTDHAAAAADAHRALGPAFEPHLARNLMQLGAGLCMGGQYAVAVKHLTEAVDLARRTDAGEKTATTPLALQSLANATLLAGYDGGGPGAVREAARSKAIKLVEEALATLTAAPNGDPWHQVQILRGFAAALAAVGERELAAEYNHKADAVERWLKSGV